MSPLAESPFERKAGLPTLALLSATFAASALWRFGWPQYDLAALAQQTPSWVAVSMAIFLAACRSSTVGFAFSAIAAAMIFHLMPDHVEAVQITMVASVAIQACSVASLYRTISWRACAPFLIGGVATLPAGIYLLLSFDPRAYIVAMGAALVLYGACMLVRRPRSIGRCGLLPDVVAGALGGMTGPLAAFPGVFVTIWRGIRDRDKMVQRCIYQPYILVLQVLALGAALRGALERRSARLPTCPRRASASSTPG